MLEHLLALLLLAVAVSLDGFGVGVTYGLRRIRIPVVSVVIIAFCSGFVVWSAMQIGTVLSGYMSPATAKRIGAYLLVLLGGWAIFQYWRSRSQSDRGEQDHSDPAPETGSKTVMTSDGNIMLTTPVIVFEWKRLGLVIQILRRPQIADVDSSGIISASEAVLLGFALSLDSFGAGLGAAMLGFSPLMTAFVISSASGLFLLGGMRLGLRFAAWRGMQTLSVLPGIMLIVIGIMRLL
ncbi:MntP/YtaF family protein [Paenibacillus sp. sptzw28]|uniref:MntP/YtaF family protein n=1 Tax=Paenibacillus sp. sptzw28 TaxID=715179 RepID=UPI001C6F2D73|nr:MntP/YtaF family protein [Paenibacillus sp. sptzw28]QYR23287.1 MntP/YtaF family protein [Paenibacillus sp. sptzw28]